ncbi:unnamed protein product [Anisakis simplex]|uniref:HMG box domain-containing protein n=1 Tax=Anisakis simplex TaxID=6269 RepID=A0A0M3J5N9_ANISI|nr:unnamed protein product [Anisakis simplex]
MREAVLLSSLSMNTAIDILSAFLSTGSSIQMDPEFPKKPRNAFTIFLKNTCMDSKGMDIKMAMTNCSSQWKSELFSTERERSEKQYLEQQKEYLRQLNAYKEKHPNLNKEHLEFINKLMLNTRKWVSKAEGTELKSPKKPKAPPAKVSKGVATKPTKTPFELFCMSKSDKYAELDEEKRERKLRKKFDKLTAAEKEIYENLAAAL